MNIAYRPVMAHPMFPEEMTALMRFACTDEDHACPVCNAVARTFWTMLVPFVHFTEATASLQAGPENEALTLVCTEHPLRVPERFLGPIGLSPDPPGDFQWSSGILEGDEAWDEGDEVRE